VRVIVGGIAGALLGGALGWFLPALFASRPHEFEVLALLALQTFAAGIGATVGFIVGGALVARYAEAGGAEPDESADRNEDDSPGRTG
jgi:hypothetical protein